MTDSKPYFEDRDMLCKKSSLEGHDESTCIKCKKVRWIREREFPITIHLRADMLEDAKTGKVRFTFEDTAIKASSNGENLGEMIGAIGGYELHRRDNGRVDTWSINMQDMWEAFWEFTEQLEAQLNELFPSEE